MLDAFIFNFLSFKSFFFFLQLSILFFMFVHVGLVAKSNSDLLQFLSK